MPAPASQDRYESILLAVVEEYLHSAAPVASRTVTQRLERPWSAATVRNVMAELEEEGYLEQPHTSAGRVPTSKAMRKYLDEMMDLEPLEETETRELTHHFEAATTRELHGILILASQILSSESQSACVAVTPNYESLAFSRFEFVSLSPHRVLALLVSSLGLLTQKIILVDEPLSQEDLNRASRCLNELVVGATLGEIDGTVTEMLRHVETLYHEEMQRAVRLAGKLFPVELAETEVIVEGAPNLISTAGLSDVRQLKETLEALENKGLLLKLFRGFEDTSGVSIALGSELQDPRFERMSVVSSSYKLNGTSYGVLSVVGPTPMAYAKVASLVGFITSQVNSLLEEYQDPRP